MAGNTSDGFTRAQAHGALAEGVDAWSRVRVLGVFLSALAIVFDGFDNQALGLAIPAISKEWGVIPASLAPASFMSLAGMTLGTAIAGLLGDRYGRRAMMVVSVTLFGLFTLSTPWVNGVGSLTLIRFLTGVGLGGAMPNATALAAEFSPVRVRPLTVTATIVCVPLGGLLGGVVAATILPSHGWRAMFYVAGAIPLVLALVLGFLLPESPSFAAGAPLTGKGEDAKTGMRALFAPDYLRDTVSVWAAFFLCLVAIYTSFSWLPAALAGAGLDSRTASLGLACFNLGGVAGALLAALAIARFGSRMTMTVLASFGALVAVGAVALGVRSFSHESLLITLTALGFGVNGVQTTLFALASHIYPTRVRATGVGSALGFGRLGALSSSLLGGYVLAGGSMQGYFTLLAVAMAGTTGALLLVRNHISGKSGR